MIEFQAKPISFYSTNMINPILIDIDFDFFLSSEKTILEMPDKEYWLSPKDLLPKLNSIPVHSVASHKEVLKDWDSRNIHGATCYHFDAHHDLWDDEDLIAELPLGTRTDFVSDGNYLIFALRENIISELVIIAPDWQDISSWQILLQHQSLAPYAHRIRFTKYSDFAPRLDDVLLSANHAYCALSPIFTPGRFFDDFLQFTASDRKLLSTASNLQNDYIRRASVTEQISFFYNRALDVRDASCPLFHGSSISNLDTLEPCEGKLFASPSPAFAASFGLPLYSNEGWSQGVESIVEERPFVYILVPEGMEYTLNAPMTLYTITDNSAFTADGCVKGYEFSSTESVPTSSCIEYSSVQEALTAYNVRCYFKSNADQSSIPADILLRYKSEIESRFQRDLEDLVKIPFFDVHISVFLIALKGYPPSQFPCVSKSVWIRILTRFIMPILSPLYCSEIDDYHGQEHAYSVALHALQNALEQDVNPIPSLLAATLHDIGRVDDNEDEQHAEDSALIAHAILSERFNTWVSDTDIEQILSAIRGHVNLLVPTNLVESILWDSDRLRIAWERGFDRTFFSTVLGADCARRGELFTKNSQTLFFDRKINELKIETTENCNLTCTFCHKIDSPKANPPTRNINSETWHKLLDAAETSGVYDLRVTGGEPLVHPMIDSLLNEAKKRGFTITMNTNGLLLDESRINSLTGLVDCFKISIPASNAKEMSAITRNAKSWDKKLTALGTLLGYGFKVEALTIMTPTNIQLFDEFIDLLGPLSNVRWVPLRAESTFADKRPVTRLDMTTLALKIYETKCASNDRWDDLYLGLAVPFCAIDEPILSAYVFKGRADCSPISSLSVDSSGNYMSCYSNREPMDDLVNIHLIARSSKHSSFGSLPTICQECPYCVPCRGGCTHEAALELTEYGLIDYLANPSVIKR